MSLAFRWSRLPPWGKGLVVAGAVGALALSTRAAMKLDLDALLRVPGVTQGKVAIVRWMLDEWKRSGRLTPDEQAALLAAGFKEGAFKLNAISPDGAPDDKGGKAWGTFQFLATTLETLGSSIGEVTPRRNADGSIPLGELERAARGSARVAEKLLFFRWKKFGRVPYIEHFRKVHGGDAFRIAREMFVGWNSGSRTWAEVEAVPPSKVVGSLGYVHFTVSHKLDVLNGFRAALGLRPVHVVKTV